MRLSATKLILELAERHERELRHELDCQHKIHVEAIQRLNSAEQQFDAVMALFAGAEITRADADFLLKVIDCRDAAVATEAAIRSRRQSSGIAQLTGAAAPQGDQERVNGRGQQ